MLPVVTAVTSVWERKCFIPYFNCINLMLYASNYQSIKILTSYMYKVGANAVSVGYLKLFFVELTSIFHQEFINLI